MIEAYLQSLRSGLKALPEAEVADILSELRGHLLEQADIWGEAGAVAAMGPPDELARLYLAERIAGRAERARSPFPLLKATAELAGLGLGALRSLLASSTGYALGLALIFLALLKPVVPDRIGVWRIDDRIGRAPFSYHPVPPSVGQEILGWWFVPIALVLGGLLLFLAWRHSLAAVRRPGRARAEMMARGRDT